MTEISPAAQAVLDAIHLRKSATDRYSILYRWVASAALRAATDQVVPGPKLPYDSCCDVSASAIRTQLLAIAAELEGAN